MKDLSQKRKELLIRQLLDNPPPPRQRPRKDLPTMEEYGLDRNPPPEPPYFDEISLYSTRYKHVSVQRIRKDASIPIVNERQSDEELYLFGFHGGYVLLAGWGWNSAEIARKRASHRKDGPYYYRRLDNDSALYNHIVGDTP